MPQGRSPRELIFMVLSSRDRRFRQCRGYLVRVTARTPPPAFLFPIQRCQRPDWLSPTPLFSAGGRRRRLSIGRPLWCQPVFSDLPQNSEKPEGVSEKSAKTTPGRRRGNPLTVGSDSVEARENTHFREKSKGGIFPFRTAWNWPRPSGRRYLGAAPCPVNRRLCPGRFS
jgi:hypothetical protein